MTPFLGLNFTPPKVISFSLSLLYNRYKGFVSHYFIMDMSVLLPPKIYIMDVSLCFCLPKGYGSARTIDTRDYWALEFNFHM